MATRNEKRAQREAEAAQEQEKALPTAAQILKAEEAWDDLREQPEMVGFPLMTPRDQEMFQNVYCAGFVQALQNTGWGTEDSEGGETHE